MKLSCRLESRDIPTRESVGRTLSELLKSSPNGLCHDVARILDAQQYRGLFDSILIGSKKVTFSNVSLQTLCHHVAHLGKNNL